MADHLGDDKHLPHCAHRHAESEQHNGAVAIEYFSRSGCSDQLLGSGEP